MPEYKELSDKIGNVELKMTEKLGEVLAEMRGLGANITASLDHIKEMRADMERVKELATKAKDSTDSAHKRLDKQEGDMKAIEANMKPITEANVVERLKGLETTVRWAATTVIGAIIAGAIAALFFFAKGG